MDLYTYFMSDDANSLMEAVNKGVPSFLVIPYRDNGETKIANLSEEVSNIVKSDLNRKKKLEKIKSLYSRFSKRLANGQPIMQLFRYLTGATYEQISDIDPSIYTTMKITDTYEDNLATWMDKVNIQLVKDIQDLQIIKTAVDQFAELYSRDDIPMIANMMYSIAKVKCYPKLLPNGEDIEAEDIPYLFSESIVDEYVPFVATKVNDNTHVKILSVPGGVAKYSSSDSNTSIDVIPESRTSYENIVYPSSFKVIKNDVLVFSMWTGDPQLQGKAYNGRKNEFCSMSIKPTLGMTIHVPPYNNNKLSDSESIKKRINHAFPMINLDNDKIAGYRFNFHIVNTHASDKKLINILIYQIGKPYEFFRFDKTDMSDAQPYNLKKDNPLVLLFRTGEVSQQRLYLESGVKVKIEKQYSESEMECRGTNILGDNRTDYGNVKLPAGSQSYSVRITNGVSTTTIKKIQAILRVLIYMAYEEDPESEDYDYIRVANLMDIDSDLTYDKAKKRGVDLIPNYGTICSERPVISTINDPEAVVWADSKGNKLYLKSTYDTKPYVVTMIKQMGEKVVRYPICSASPFNKYVEGSMGKSNSYETIMKPYQKGFLHGSIKHQLVSYEPAPYCRYGTKQNSYSVIHCINMAFGVIEVDKQSELDFNNLKNGVYKDGTPINYEICKQEMYDVDVSSIKDYIGDGLYLDPVKFWRLLEQYFGINIVLYSSFKYLAEPELTRPRSKGSYYKHYIHDKPTVIILAHVGTRFSSSGYPHCELIGTDNVLLLSTGITRFLWDIICDMYQDIVLYNVGDVDINIGMATTAKYPEDIVIQQKINDSGKCIAIRFMVNGLLCDYVVSECEPYNCKSIQDSYILSDISIIQHLQDKPVQISVVGDNINGIWMFNEYYNLYGFMPIIPTNGYNIDPSISRLPVNNNYNFASYIPNSAYQHSITTRFNNEVFKIIVNWLHSICYFTVGVNVIANALVVSNNHSTLSFTKIPSQFPKIDNLKEAVIWLTKHTDNFIGLSEDASMWYIMCPTDRYKQQILKLLNVYSINVTRRINIDEFPRRTNLDYIFENKDYSSKTVLYFNSSSSYTNWLESSLYFTSDLMINISKVQHKLRQYIYRNDGNYYIIQNFSYSKPKKKKEETQKIDVVSSYDKSVLVSSIWQSERLNLGYDPHYYVNGRYYTASEYVNEYSISNVSIYSVYKSSTMISNNGLRLSEELHNAVMIIHYGSGRYGSILRI